MIASLDFETYSAAGYVWDFARSRWTAPYGATRGGLAACGHEHYARHESTEILIAGYHLPGDTDVKSWHVGLDPPCDLLDYVQSGRPLRAHNSPFEAAIWEHVAVARMGWPAVRPEQWHCTMALCHVSGLPGSLDAATAALGLSETKAKAGAALIRKFSIPRSPTKHDDRLRVHPTDDPSAFAEFVEYCAQDVRAEMALAAALPPMTPAEREFWLIDQAINRRGVAVDLDAVDACIRAVDRLRELTVAECESLTGGIRPSQVGELTAWLSRYVPDLSGLTSDDVDELLARTDLPPTVRRVVELRALSASASIKKLYAIRRAVCPDGRLRGLYVHHGARTGRPAGRLVQPTNMPRSGPKLKFDSVGLPFCADLADSPWTGEIVESVREWGPDCVDPVLSVVGSIPADQLPSLLGNPLDVLTGCMRGLFVAAPGKLLVASDYSAIEAVVAAAISGQQWRLDAFARGEDIYLASISQMTGTPLETYKAYKTQHGHHHPDRQRGKIAELALGYGGWIGAMRQFGAEGTDDELKSTVLAWRDASSAIVEAWGGQGRGWPGSWRYVPELYGLEGAAVAAIQRPDTPHSAALCTLTYHARPDVLTMRLPSGRRLSYRQPRLSPSIRREGELSVSFMTNNTNPKMGSMGWVRMETYGGRLFENACQAIAHDIQRFGILALERAGWPVVLHVYDEDVAEVPEALADVDAFERIMSQLPPWAADWPLRVGGGYAARRYQK